MPVDAGIYGTLNAPGTGLATLGDLAQLREVRAQREAATAKAQADAEKARREQQQAAMVQSVFQKHSGPQGPDKKAILAELYSVDPDAATKFETHFNQTVKAANDEQRAEREAELKAMERDVSLLRSVKNPAHFQFVKSRLSDPELAAWLGDELDPSKIEFLGNTLLSARDYDVKMKEIDAKHTDDLALVLGHASLAQDQAHWDDAMAEAQARGVGGQLAALGLNPVFSPEEAARAGQLTMTPKDLAVLKNQATDDERQAAAAAEAARHNRVMEGRPTGATAPVSVMGPNGKPIFVTPQQAIGMTPASSREQGRPVTSGDAGRISDLDNSLNDIQTVRGTLQKPGSTGTVAKIGTVLPNFVTNAIGWTEPKQKQATIDRVKQVIGKALEGGVLRKEDEAKYEKILPTIYDSADVVKTKLDGLERALVLRRTTTLDALEDAGYDTSRFVARGPAGAAKGTTAPQGRFNPATGKVEPVK